MDHQDLDNTADGESTGPFSTLHQKQRPTDTSTFDSAQSNWKKPKRRSAQACLSCRARKVRCDVVQGAPCWNCRCDNLECEVGKNRRKRKHRLPTPPNTTTTSTPTVQKLPPRSPVATASTISDYRQSLEDSQEELSQAGLSYQRPTYISHMNHDGTPNRLASLPVDSLPPSTWTCPTRNFNSTIPRARGPQSIKNLDSSIQSTLPPFIQPIHSEMEADDAWYLQTIGALTLISPRLENAVLAAYIEYVHPYMPVVHLHDFLGRINARNGSSGQISLLLYHAVMFTGVAFVDMNFLCAEGYASRKVARKILYRKAKLLYDFDYEKDRFTIVQSLLLMTYWYESPHELKDAWHWLGVAVSIAHTIGLHRDPENTSLTEGEKKLRKCVWWSCFMRDRLISLGMRRPTQIKDDDCDIPLLTETDLQLRELTNDCITVPSSCALIRNLDMQKELAALCIAKCQLCVLIGTMLRSQYSVYRGETTTTAALESTTNLTQSRIEDFDEIDKSFTLWYESLPTGCQYMSPTTEDVDHNRSPITLQRTLLHMTYHAAIYAFHRPQCSPSSPRGPLVFSYGSKGYSRLKVIDSATHITSMASELHHLYLDKCLPTTGVTAIITAMAVHLLEMRSPTLSVRQRAITGFRRCSRVMNELRQIYPLADSASNVLEQELHRITLKMSFGQDLSLDAAKDTDEPWSFELTSPYSYSNLDTSMAIADLKCEDHQNRVAQALITNISEPSEFSRVMLADSISVEGEFTLESTDPFKRGMNVQMDMNNLDFMPDIGTLSDCQIDLTDYE